MQLYDMHSHILPQIDDGADSVETSVKLIECLKKQGVTNICLTPHFYTNEMSADDFVEKRNESFEKLKPFIPEGVKVVLGGEVYVTRYLFGNEDLSGLTYGNSKFILTEYGYGSHFSEQTIDYFVKLKENFGLNSVLPHVERYTELMRDPSIIRELKDMGVIIQTNISRYTKDTPFFKKRKMIKLINDGLVDVIGTDAHSFKHNSPQLYTEALNFIEEKCGRHVVKKMMSNAEKIFSDALS